MGTTQEFIMKPKIDFCFKELMAEEKVRRGFISALLEIPADSIQRTILVAAELPRESADDKLGILDVKVGFEDGTQMDIEIQLGPFAAWPERSLYYLSRMFCGRLKAGEGYSFLEKCIHVGILDFILFDEDADYYSRYHFRKDWIGTLYSDKMEIHILELPKIKKYDYPESELLDWVRFFSSERKEEMAAVAAKNEYINEAFERLKHLSEDDKKRMAYEQRQKAIMDHEYLMNQNLQEGRQYGIKEAKHQMVINLLHLGNMSDEDIMKVAEISREQLETYRKDMPES